MLADQSHAGRTRGPPVHSIGSVLVPLATESTIVWPGQPRRLAIGAMRFGRTRRTGDEQCRATFLTSRTATGFLMHQASSATTMSTQSSRPRCSPLAFPSIRPKTIPSAASRSSTMRDARSATCPFIPGLRTKTRPNEEMLLGGGPELPSKPAACCGGFHRINRIGRNLIGVVARGTRKRPDIEA